MAIIRRSPMMTFCINARLGHFRGLVAVDRSTQLSGTPGWFRYTILRGLMLVTPSVRQVLWIALLAGCVFGQPAPPGRALFERACANCHSTDGAAAPSLAALSAMSTEGIFDSLMKGKMKD